MSLTQCPGTSLGDGRGGEGVGGGQPADSGGQAEPEEVEAEHLGVGWGGRKVGFVEEGGDY